MDGCWWRKKKQQNVRMPVNGQFLRTTVNIHQQMFNTHPAMRREEKLRAFHIQYYYYMRNIKVEAATKTKLRN